LGAEDQYGRDGIFSVQLFGGKKKEGGRRRPLMRALLISGREELPEAYFIV